MAESQEKFVTNPKGKAPIWEFFRFHCKDGQVDSTKAYCTECKASVKLGGGTSNMSAHVRRHLPLLLNKPFGKTKVTSVRNPPGPAPIDSTGAGPSASTDLDVDPLTNLKTSDAAPKHTQKNNKKNKWRLAKHSMNFIFPSRRWFGFHAWLSYQRNTKSCFLSVWFFFRVCVGFFVVVVVVVVPPPPPHFKSTRIWEMFRLINWHSLL